MNIWKLYYNCKILQDKNFKVDNLETYLATLTYDSITGDTENTAPQRIKHNLNLLVKIDKSQTKLDFFNTANNVNYISIQNDGETYPTYYFVINKQWTSENTISLVLKMDTVNTFTVARNSFTISDRTLVHREHKDRLEKDLSYIFLQMPIYAPIYKKELRIAKTISITGTYEAYNDEEIIVKIYNADGTLDTSYSGSWLEFYDLGGGLGYAIKLENPNGDIIWQMSKFNITNNYNAGKFITVEFTQNLADYPNTVDWFDAIRKAELRRIIDLYSEGINAPLYKKELYEINPDNLDWYLIYKNQNDPDDSLLNPVDCLLCASRPLNVKGISNIYPIVPADITAYDEYVLLWKENKNATLYYHITGETESRAIQLQLNGNQCHDIAISSTGTAMSIKVGTEYNRNSATKWADYGQYIPSNNIDLITIVGGENLNCCGFYMQEDTTLLSLIEAQDDMDISVNDTARLIPDISAIDKTDPKLIKIIKCPYCPTYYNPTSQVLGNGEWEYDSATGLPKLSNLDARFESYLLIDEENNPLEDLYMEDDIVVDTTKNAKYESKLYHSDYWQPKFVYDSFGFAFMLERVDYQRVGDNSFHIKYNATGTIHSRFLFTFEDYYCPNYSEQDYNNILYVNRNNDITIYNQQFMNYLRAGYNYDVKAKERKEQQSWLMTGLSIIGSIASFASTPFTGPVGIAGGIALATTAVGSIANSVFTTAQAEANLEQKMAQLKNQATTVEGADDIDLMSIYANNKAKMVRYELSPKMKECMFDIFYYTGYIMEVMKVPNETSRYWFNFVSCDLQIEMNVNIPKDILDDLKECYKNGITVMHDHSGVYDWNREKENWENSLIGG